MKKKYLLVALLIFIISIGVTSMSMQNDTFYSIKIGEDIFKYGIDFIDHHSIHTLNYSYPHILFDSIVYLTYNFFNLNGLYILTIIFTFILGIIIFIIDYKLSSNYLFSLLFSILTLLFLKNFLTLRAQIISISIFALEYFFLQNLYNNKKKTNIIFLFLLGVLLVNTHVATYPFYLIMFLPFLITSKFRKDIILTFVLVCLCGFISFMGLDSYTYLFNTLLNTTTNYIMEHQPLVLIEHIDIIFIFLLIILFFTNKKIKIELYDKLLLLGVSFMTLVSVRHSIFLILFTLIITAHFIGKYTISKESNNIKNITKKIFTLKGKVLIILLVSIISLTSFISYPKHSFIDKTIYPVNLVSYVKKNIDYKNIRIFNDINIGSYLMLNDIPVFIDSRTDLYTYSYNYKEDIFNDYIDTIYFNKYYEDIFTKYKITHIIIRKNSNLNVYLNEDDNYTVIYQDNYFVLYKKNSKKVI